MTLCEKLIDLRRKAGLSQEQMAQQLDVSRQAVSKWETRRVPARHQQAPGHRPSAGRHGGLSAGR